MNRIDDRLMEETARATMRSNHGARVLIFESSCRARFNLEYAKSCSSRERDRRTIGALCSRGVPGGTHENKSPSHRTNTTTCVRQKSTISFPLHHPLLSVFCLSFSRSVFLFLCAPPFFCPLSPISERCPPSSSFFLCMYLRHVAGDPTANACLHAHEHTRGLRNRVSLWASRHTYSKLE